MYVAKQCVAYHRVGQNLYFQKIYSFVCLRRLVLGVNGPNPNPPSPQKETAFASHKK